MVNREMERMWHFLFGYLCSWVIMILKAAPTLGHDSQHFFYGRFLRSDLLEILVILSAHPVLSHMVVMSPVWLFKCKLIEIKSHLKFSS